jgi:hypothetical protein
METATLLPLSAAGIPQLTNPETGEVASIAYLSGRPRQYRFDASRGLFNLKGETPITKPKESLTLIPIAFRIFRDSILGQSTKRWAELFFLNQGNQVCNLLLHGYSVDNLMDLNEEIFYEQVNLCQIELTITPVERTSKVPEANNSRFFIAEFSFKRLSAAAIAVQESVFNDMPLWRGDTLTGDAELILSYNFNPPVEACPQLPVAEPATALPAAA